MITLEELKEKIVEQVDEVDLIDLLKLTTKDLVEAFEDLIEENSEKLIKELDIETSDNDDD